MADSGQAFSLLRPEVAVESRHEPREPWGLVAAGAALMAISSGIWYTGSVFFVALLQEFGQNYAFTAGIFSLFTVLYGIWGILAGSLLDRYGPRRVVLAGGIFLPVALACSGLASSLPQLYLTHGVLTPFGLSLMGYVPVSVLLTRSFRKRRGLALGTASAGVGVGISVVVPLTQILIDQIGWRLAYLGLAGISASVILPIALFAIRDRQPAVPKDASNQSVNRGPAVQIGQRSNSQTVSRSTLEQRGWTLSTALRSREFWLVSATFTLLNSPIQLILTHHVAHLLEVGQSKVLVAGLVGLVGLFSIPGKVGWGYLSDRVWPEWIYVGGSACVIGAILVLLVVDPASSARILYPYAILIGIGYAVSPAMTPIMCGIFFGGPHFGVIFGALNTLYHAGGASGVWLAGLAHDLTGDYRLPFLASILSVVLSVGCVWIAAPRRLRPSGSR